MSYLLHICFHEGFYLLWINFPTFAMTYLKKNFNTMKEEVAQFLRDKNEIKLTFGTVRRRISLYSSLVILFLL